MTHRRLAPQVEPKLWEAKCVLKELEDAFPQVALDWALEKPGAQERISTFQIVLAGARWKVECLGAAFALAVQKDKQADEEARARLQKSREAALEHHLRVGTDVPDGLRDLSAPAILDKKWEGRDTFTVEEAGEILGLSRGSSFAAARAGTIPVLRFGRRMVVPRAALMRLIAGAQAVE